MPVTGAAAYATTTALKALPSKLFAVGIFLEEPYKDLNVKGRGVIEIEAFNGDSAIYFSMQGTKTVRPSELFAIWVI